MSDVKEYSQLRKTTSVFESKEVVLNFPFLRFVDTVSPLIGIIVQVIGDNWLLTWDPIRFDDTTTTNRGITVDQLKAKMENIAKNSLQQLNAEKGTNFSIISLEWVNVAGEILQRLTIHLNPPAIASGFGGGQGSVTPTPPPKPTPPY